MPSGGGSQQTSTQGSSGPPQWEAPYLKYGVSQAQQLYQSPSPSYYPGSTVANLSPTTQAGIQAATARGLSGDPAENAGSNYLQRVMGGQYLGGQNLDPVHASIAAATIPNVNAQFSLGGRYGSDAHAGTMATSLANAYAPYDYGNYQTERGMQQQAAGMAPSYASQDWQDIQGLQQAGQLQDTQGQNLVNANVNHWNYNQNLAQNKLQQYMSTLQNLPSGTQGTTTNTAPGGGWMSILGGIAGALL